MNKSGESIASEENTATDSYVAVRLLVLVLLVLMVNLWTLHHSANKVVGLLLSNFPFAFMSIYGFFSKVLKSEEKKPISDGLRALVLILLKPSVLMGLYLAFFILGSVFSSVTIMAGGEPVKNIQVKLIPEGEKAGSEHVVKTLNGPDGIARFFSLTTPFGRPFYVEADGYQRLALDLYPWMGKRLRIGRDFQPSPSVLFRVPPALITTVRAGTLKVFGDDELLFEGRTGSDSGAILLGPLRALSSGFEEDWRLQLMSLNIQGATMAVCLRKWQNFSHDRPKTFFRPDMSIRAEYYTGNGKLAAVGRIILTAGKLQDVLLSAEGE